MQQWEYCMVGPIRSNDNKFDGAYPQLTHLTDKGVDSVRIRPPMTGERGLDYSLAKTIAELGAEGWEMVGCGNVAVDMHFLYFKRPRQAAPAAPHAEARPTPEEGQGNP